MAKNQENLEKGLPQLVSAMGLAAQLATGASTGSGQTPAPQVVQQAPQEAWPKEGLHTDLHPIAQLESSWGKNIHHMPHSKGEFHTALGAVGLKPVTAHEEYMKSKPLQTAYPGFHNPEDFLKKIKEDKKFYNLLASSHFARLKAIHGTPEKAAFAWRWGTGAAARATPEQVAEDHYVQKYDQLRGLKKGEDHDPIGHHDNSAEVILGMKRRNVGQAELKRGIEHSDPEVVKFAALHPALKVNIGLICHPKKEVRRLMVQRDDITPEQISKIFMDPELIDLIMDHPLIGHEQREALLDSYENANGGEIDAESAEMLGKSIGFVAFPKLGINGPKSPAMPTEMPKNSNGYMASPAGDGVEPSERFLQPAVNNALASKQMNASGAHEEQHAVFHELRHRYGEDAHKRALDHVLNAINPQEQNLLMMSMAVSGKEKYANKTPHQLKEESLAHAHNVLMDPNYRTKMFQGMEDKMRASGKPDFKISPEQKAKIIISARKAFNKVREAAKHLNPKDIGAGGILKAEDDSFDFGANVDPNKRLHDAAMRSVSRMHPEKQQIARNWIEYTKGAAQRPVIPPELERHMAKFGIVDPQGYDFGEDGRSLNRPIGGKRHVGKEPDDLKRVRLMNIEHKTGVTQNYKSEDMEKVFTPPSIAPVTMPVKSPTLHNNVESFMTELKGLPKEGPHRGKFITANMNHAPFLTALGAHKQGPAMHAQLTGYLNGRANAGVGRGAKVTMKSEELDKAKSGPTFPKLGLPDNRRETDIVTTPRQQEIKQRSMANAISREDPKNKKLIYSRFLSDKSNGLAPGMGASSASYSLGTKLRTQNAYGSPKDTQEHENLHMMLKRVSDKHGGQARFNLVTNLLNHAAPKLPRRDMEGVEDFFQARNGGAKALRSNPMGYEERLATTLNYLNSPSEREAYGNYKGLNPAQKLQHHKNMRDFYGHMMNAANQADESWLTNKPNPIMGKSEHDQVLDQMGVDEHVIQVIHAVRFLTGNNDLETATIYHHVFDDGHTDVVQAVLEAFGMDVTPENRRAIDAIVQMSKVQKSDDQELFKSLEGLTIKPLLPEDEELANNMSMAADEGKIEEIRLSSGKYSSGTCMIKLNDDKAWLLKPNAPKMSPAAGVGEEQSAQSRREAAFHDLAFLLGVGHRIPDTKVMLMNGREYAAIQFLRDFANLGKVKNVNPGFDQRVLEPYVQSGELFKWALLDYIAGNPDRHSGNILVGKNQDNQFTVALIDHGAAFSGESFNPAYDEDSFVPFYLRAWMPNPWEKASDEDKLHFAPDCNEQIPMLKEWVESIDSKAVSEILNKYGIMLHPTMERLDEVKKHFETIPDDSVNVVMELYLKIKKVK